MEIHERLRQARIDAGFESASQAAHRFGWAESAYRHHENGTRGFKQGVAEKYARAFRVPIEWLLLGKGSSNKKGVPVVGEVGAGAEIFPFDDGGALEWVDSMPGLGPEAVAVRVRGDSMFPRYFEGDVLIYDQHASLKAANGQECVVRLEDGRCLVKIVRVYANRVTLESYNAPPIEVAKIEWAAPIVWVKRARL